MSAVSIKKLKVALGADIRRFPLPVPPTIEGLRASIAAAFKLDASAVTLSYRDDEGDLCTLASTAELLEALAVCAAAGQSTLKLFVNARDDAGFVNVDADDTESLASFAPSESKPADRKAPVAEEAKSAPPPAPETKPEAPKPEPKPEVPKPAELVALVTALLEDAAVRAALPVALSAGLAALKDGDDVTTVIDTVLASSDALAEHASVRRLRPLLPLVLPKLEPLAAVLREQDLSFLPILVEQMLPQAVMFLRMFGSGELPFSPIVLLSQMHPGLSNLFENVAAGAGGCCGGERSEAKPTGCCESKAAECGASAAPAPEPQGPVHRQFSCDGCNKSPIVGVRFHCTVCPDYDLCTDCEARNVHTAAHPLLKIRLPLESPEYQAAQVHVGVTCDGCGKAPIEGVRYKCSACDNFDLCAACEAKGEHPATHPLVKYRTPVRGHGLRPGAFGVPPPFGGFGGMGRGGCPRFGGGLGGFGRFHQRGGHGGHHLPHFLKHIFARHCPRGERAEGQADACPGKSEACAGANACAGQSGRPRVTFLRDANLPDGSEVAAGATLLKGWTVTNSGDAQWPEGVKLIFLRGERELSAEEEFAVPRAAAGETVDLQAQLTVPARAGRFVAYFTLATAERVPFGPRLWVDVVVPEGAAEVKAAVAAEEVKAAPVEEKKTTPPPTAAAAPAPAAAVPTVPADVDPSDPRLVKYAMQVQILASMGFRNRALALAALDRHDGDITKTYNDLVAAVLSTPEL